MIGVDTAENELRVNPNRVRVLRVKLRVRRVTKSGTRITRKVTRKTRYKMYVLRTKVSSLLHVPGEKRLFAGLDNGDLVTVDLASGAVATRESLGGAVQSLVRPIRVRHLGVRVLRVNCSRGNANLRVID